MRSIWNSLSDPSLHFLAVALFLVYLTFGNGSWSRNSSGAAEAPPELLREVPRSLLAREDLRVPTPQGIVNAWP